MYRFLKTLLLWLLLAVLPLQGVAAVMQTACGPMKHDDTAETTMSVQPHQHGGDVMDMPDTHAADIDEISKSALSHDESHNKSPGNKHGHAACSACASCCVGASAPPSTVVIIPAYSSPLPSVATPAVLVSGYVPAGLERPPKRITT